MPSGVTPGGTLGMPIIKNKLFVFGVYEKIENGQASPGTYTLLTAAERRGDFSQTLTAARALRVIYDPASTVGANRLPFAGNIIPVNQQDSSHESCWPICGTLPRPAMMPRCSTISNTSMS